MGKPSPVGGVARTRQPILLRRRRDGFPLRGDSVLHNFKHLGDAMKTLSASIVVVAGSAIFIRASFISHDGTNLFVSAVGCTVLGIGMYAWIHEMKNPQN